MKPSIKVIGCGNPWASDDGVGLEIVRRLQKRPYDRVEFIELPHPGVELLEHLKDCDLVVLVDAVRTDLKAGALIVRKLQFDDLEDNELFRNSTHGLSVKETLELARSLGQELPSVILWGVQVATTKPGNKLSASVNAALPEIVSTLDRELKKLLRTR
jgi:hydrogenase maturation protease